MGARLLELLSVDVFDDKKHRQSCGHFSAPLRCNRQISSTNEDAALNRCIRAIKVALGAYPNTLKEDQALLHEGLSGLPSFLVTLRRDEKTVLHWCMKLFQAALNILR